MRWAQILILAVGIALADESFAKPQAAPRNVAVIVHEGVELLDFAGPAEVFSSASVDGRRAYNVYTVAPRKELCKSNQNVLIMPDYAIADCPPPAILVIPGGATQNLTEDATMMAWIKRTAEQSELTLTVCTGAFALSENGLLDGLEATTHYSALAALRREHPKVKVRENVRFVDNGKFVTTAGVSAGIDGALHVVSRLSGLESAWRTARYMEYDWKPPALPSGAAPAERSQREALDHRIHGRHAEAAAAYEKILAEDPKNEDAAIKLAQSYAAANEWEKAAAAADRALALAPPDATMLLTIKARAELGLNRYDAAIPAYERAIAAGETNPNNLYNLACALARTGQKEKALDQLARALSAGPWMKKQARNDGDLASLRDDARFDSMVN